MVFSRHFNEDRVSVLIRFNFDELDIFQFENLYDWIGNSKLDKIIKCYGFVFNRTQISQG